MVSLKRQTASMLSEMDTSSSESEDGEDPTTKMPMCTIEEGDEESSDAPLGRQHPPPKDARGPPQSSHIILKTKCSQCHTDTHW